MLKNVLMGLVLVATMGCGAKPGASDGAPLPIVIPPPPPPELTSLSIAPATLTLFEGATQGLAATAHYSDGSSHAADAAWLSSQPAIASLDVAQGTATTLTAVIQGTSVVTAQVGVKIATLAVTVQWDVAQGIGPVFGNHNLQVMRYPSNGSAPTNVYSGITYAGSTMDRAGQYIYVIEWDPVDSVELMRRIDVVTGATTVVVPNIPYTQLMGLDTDSAGRVYGQNFGGGQLYRFDPVTNQVETLNPLRSNSMDVAIDGDDSVYGTNWLVNPGTTWMWKQDAAGNNLPWSSCPATVQGIGQANLVIPGGMSINSANEAFIQDMNGNRLFRHIDVNGDGGATDAGETVVFATMNHAWDENFTYGISVTAGGGVLLNVKINDNTNTGAANAGLYWLRDADGDGVCTGAEITLYNATYIVNGTDGGCPIVKR